MTVAFLGVILLSLLLAWFSRRGHLSRKAEDFFIASGQFNAILFFFLAVGETYSIGSMAADVLARAVARGVYEASLPPGMEGKTWRML